MATRCLRVIALASELGASRADLLRVVGRTERKLSDPNTRVSKRRLLATWAAAMRETRNPALPILVAQRADVGGYDVFGYAMSTARSAQESLTRFIRYHDVIDSTGRWRFELSAEQLTVRWVRDGERDLGMRVANEQSVATLVHVGREMFGDDVPLTEVRFRHAAPDGDLSAHEAHFRAPIRFGADEDALVLPLAIFTRVPSGTDRARSDHFIERVDEQLRRIATESSHAMEVARVISRLLVDGEPSSTVVGRELGMSDRTLRRRLAEEDTTFERLLAEVRRERAMESLQAGASVRQAALHAGFADESAFARAFRSWTGKRPSDIARDRTRRKPA
jgi:AraC-like DNA-binding protein